MEFKDKLKKISLNFLFCFLIFLILSLFFSLKKIFIPLVLGLLILFLNLNIKKIIFINLLILTIILKIVFIFFNPEDYNSILSKTVYEKNFLYGVKNLKLNATIYGGNMNPKDKTKSKKVKITTDKLGFRNSISLKDSDYVLIGDSMLHNHRIDDENLINSVLNKSSSSKFYNASLSSTDIGHYLETIRYFKENNYQKKFIAFVFSGNDFLNYEILHENYANRLDNFFLRNYFEIKEYFDFFTKIKFIIQSFKKSKLLNRVDKNQFINKEKILFYKSYYVQSNQNLKFSEKFNIYNKYAPDIVIVIPTKAQVYCDYLENYNCPNINYYSLFKNIKIFQNTIIYDSTDYLRNKATIYLNENQFIYEKDDTHLDENGLKILSEFVLNKLNK